MHTEVRRKSHNGSSGFIRGLRHHCALFCDKVPHDPWSGKVPDLRLPTPHSPLLTPSARCQIRIVIHRQRTAMLTAQEQPGQQPGNPGGQQQRTHDHDA